MSITTAGDLVLGLAKNLLGASGFEKGSKVADLLVDGIIGVEIKDASGGTANQVRPIRGNVLVVYSPGTYTGRDWFVMGPTDVINDSSGMKGQHTSSALMCRTLVTKTKRYEKFFCSAQDMPNACRAAGVQQTTELIVALEEAEDAFVIETEEITKRLSERIGLVGMA